MKKENRQPKTKAIKPSAIPMPQLSQLSLDELSKISGTGGGTDGTGRSIG